jgi:hypothetical protein
MVIREATVSLEVGSCEEATGELRRLAVESGGHVVSTADRLDRSLARRSATVVLRVPSDRFDRVLGEIGEVAGEVESRTVTMTDVTEEYVDVTARLRAKRALEQRYIQLLAGAEGTSQALEVERALAEVIEQIERVEGRRRFLEDRVELATITVELAETPSIFDPLRRAFSWGLDAVVGLLALLIVIAMGLSPLAAFATLATLIGRALMRRRQRHGVGG